MKSGGATRVAAAIAAFVAAGIVLAAEEPNSERESRSLRSPAQSAPAKKPKKSKSAKNSKNKDREKETDGTQAPNRFEADRVIRSQYELNGQQLEVDPD